VISINPQNTKEIIASTSEISGGIYHSLDGGNTWHKDRCGIAESEIVVNIV